MKDASILRRMVTYAFLILAAFLSLFPFYYMFISATNSNLEILTTTPSLVPGPYLMDNWKELNGRVDMWRVFLNSVIMTGAFTGLAVLFHTMAGYALTKYKFRGQAVIFSMVMATMMIPELVMYVPLFSLMNNIGWANTYQAVIFPPLANGFGIFLMRQNLLAFPTSLIEAARIDGHGEISAFFRVVVPNLKPALGALGIYMFMSMWNNFMWPLIILGTKTMYNFPVALAVLDGVVWRKNYGMIMLAASMATIPIMIVFLVFQKQFVAGVMGGAVKE